MKDVAPSLRIGQQKCLPVFHVGRIETWLRAVLDVSLTHRLAFRQYGPHLWHRLTSTTSGELPTIRPTQVVEVNLDLG